MSYGFLKKILIGTLFVYFSIGLGAQHLLTEDQKVYPFFSWYLFYEVPSRIQSDYVVYFTAVEGEELEKRTAFIDDTLFHNINTHTTTDYYLMIQRLGNAIESANKKKIESEKRAFEENFTQPSVTYVIARRTIDPISYWLDKDVISEEDVAVFTSTGDDI